jgi:hypothetical protein
MGISCHDFLEESKEMENNILLFLDCVFLDTFSFKKCSGSLALFFLTRVRRSSGDFKIPFLLFHSIAEAGFRIPIFQQIERRRFRACARGFQNVFRQPAISAAVLTSTLDVFQFDRLAVFEFKRFNAFEERSHFSFR